MKKRTAKVLTVLAVIIGVMGVIYVVAVAVSAAKLRRVYAQLEKASRPMTAADVIPPVAADSENAALLYKSAALLLKAQPAPLNEKDQKERDLLSYISKLGVSLANGIIEPNDLGELENLLQQNVVSQALAIVQQGTSRPQCRFERDYTNGLQTNPVLLDLKGVAQVLGAKARIEARAGRPAAWDLAQTQLRFSDALRGDPSIISQLVRFNMIRLSCETIQEISRISMPGRQQADDISKILVSLDDVRPAVLAIDGERLLVGEWFFGLPASQLWATLQEILCDDSTPGLSCYWVLYHRATFAPNFLADHAAYLKTLYENADMIVRPYSPADRKEPDLGRHKLTNKLVPAIWRIKEFYLEMISQIRMTRAGLILLQYKKDQGAFPPTLDILDAREFADPFMDKPLQYRVEPEGFVLYSVGPDQEDNGGNPRQSRPWQKTGFDIVWRFPAGATTPAAK